MRANNADRLKQALLPPKDQWALLAAAFAPPDAFASAFQTWRTTLGRRLPPPISASLLPLLVPRLDERQERDPIVPHCRQTYRLAWAKNALIKRRLPDMLAPFAAAGVKPIILKGLALQAHYRGERLRAFGDVDILVGPDRFHDVIEALLDMGWRSQAFARPCGFDRRFAHAIEWHNAAGDIIDLHAHPMHHWITWPGGATLFGEGAISFQVGEADAATLGREHHLIQTVVNALAAPEPHGRWIADCIALVESGPMDWHRVVRDATRLRIAPLLAAALDLVADFLPDIPDDVRLALMDTEVDPDLFAFERKLYNRTSRARLSGHWRTLRVGAGKNLAGTIRLLPDYARFCRARRGGLLRQS